MTNANIGGYEPRFNVTRTDGKAIDPTRRYMVLDFSGADPEAVEALRLYADLKETINPQLAADLRRHIANPATAPAQHGDAQ
jgi:hypothetical protein